MKRLFYSFLAAFLMVLPCAVSAQQKYALVIGNAEYQRIDKLKNTVNDAQDIGAALQSLGYQVDVKLNLGHLQMVDAIEAFTTKLAASRANEGFFWYAGHAVQIQDENYLLPVDITVDTVSRVRAGSFSLNNLIEMLDNAKNKVNVLILDACRDNPLPATGRGGGGRGLAMIRDVPSDLFVMFSTAPGNKADDGAVGKRNSPFAEAFLKYIKSNEPVYQMAIDVTQETLKLTDQRQRPFQRGSIISEKYYSLNPQASKPSQPITPNAPAQPPQPSVTGGSVTVESEIAGEIFIDGQATGTRIKAGGTVTVSNVSTGATEVAVKDDDGKITKAPQTVMVQQGQAVTVAIKAPAQTATADTTPSAAAKAAFDKGVEYSNKGSYTEAIAEFDQAIRLHSNYADAYFKRGFAYYEKKDYDRAIADYTESIRLNPNDANVYFNRGLAYRKKNDNDRAIVDYTESIRLNSNYAKVYYGRGYAYFEKKDYDRAIADYTESIRLNPNYADAYNNRGIAYFYKKDYDRAIADYEATLRIDPNIANAKTNLEIARKAKAQ